MSERTTKQTIVSAVVVFGAALLFFGNESNVPEPKKPEQARPFMTSEEAWAACQNAIISSSKYPDKAKVPFVDDQAGLSEGYFAWGSSTKHIMLMNGLGVLAPATASCNINKQNGKITSLTINGQSII